MDSNRRNDIESIIILPFLYGYCNIDTAKKCTREKKYFTLQRTNQD